MYSKHFIVPFRRFEVRTVLCTHLKFKLNFNLTVSRIQVARYHTRPHVNMNLLITVHWYVTCRARVLVLTRCVNSGVFLTNVGILHCFRNHLRSRPTDRPTDRRNHRECSVSISRDKRGPGPLRGPVPLSFTLQHVHVSDEHAHASVEHTHASVEHVHALRRAYTHFS